MLQKSTLKFLRDLRRNNRKEWFDSHRDQYEAARSDFEHFVAQVIKGHGKRDPDIQNLEAKKCLFRIHRDVRFSKDKSPYKLNLAASIDKGGRRSGLAGYYFHLEPGNSFIAGGIWMPPPDVIRKIRQEIDYCWDEFSRIISDRKFRQFYGDLYTGEGIKLSRVPQGFDQDHDAAEYLKLKSWLVMSAVTDEALMSNKLLPATLKGFTLVMPLLKFLNRAITEDSK